MPDDDLIDSRPSTSRGSLPNREQRNSAETAPASVIHDAPEDFLASGDLSIATNSATAIERLLPSLFPFPVTFKAFKMHTHYQEPVAAIIRDLGQSNPAAYDRVQADVNARERLLYDYYQMFYMRPDIRKRYPLRLKPCPTVMRAKLLLEPFIDEESEQIGSSLIQKSSGRCEKRPPRKRKISSASSDAVAHITEKNDMSQNLAASNEDAEKETPDNNNILQHNVDYYDGTPTHDSQDIQRVQKETPKLVVPPAEHSSFVSFNVCHTESFKRKYISKHIQNWSEEVKHHMRIEMQKTAAETVADVQTTGVKVHVQSVEIITPISNIETTSQPEDVSGKLLSQSAELVQSRPAAETNAHHQQNVRENLMPKSGERTTTPPLSVVEITASQKYVNEKSVPKYCTLAYVLRMSTGLKQRIIEAILEMSVAEFRQYAHLHDGHSNVSLSDWERFYQCAIVKQQLWPINLYMHLSELVQYLKFKGLPVKQLKLCHISPKLLHWEDLIVCTDFDKCVNLHCLKSKGHVIRRADLLLERREEYYRRCWLHECWIWREPIITDAKLLAQMAVDAPVARSSITAEACVSIENQPTLYEFIKVKADAYAKAATAAASVNATRSTAKTTTTPTLSESVAATNARAASYVVMINENNVPDIEECSSLETVLTSEESNTATVTYLYDLLEGTLSQVTMPRNVTTKVTTQSAHDHNASSTQLPTDFSICDVAANYCISSTSSTNGVQETLLSPSKHFVPAKQSLEDYLFVDFHNTQAQIETLPAEVFPEDAEEFEISDSLHKNDTAAELRNHPIKQEFTALKNMQFDLTNNSDDYNCAPLSEQVIAIEDQSFTGIANDSPQKRIRSVNLLSCVDTPVVYNFTPIVENSEELTVPCEQTLSADITTTAPAISAASNTIVNNATSSTAISHTTNLARTCSRTYITKRVYNTKSGYLVPQRTHEFRALPLHIVSKNGNNDRPTENSAYEAETLITAAAAAVGGSTFSVSQALATDCTLFNTQLLEAVKAISSEVSQLPRVPVNTVVAKGATVARSPSAEVAQARSKQVINSEFSPSPQKLYKTLLYRSLCDFHYFDKLSTDHVMRYTLPSNGIQQRYMQATISSGRKTIVYGNFLDKLFLHCTPQLVRDMQLVLCDLREYHYNKFDAINTSSKDSDLRQRVMCHFLQASPVFSYCLLKFDDMSRELGRCEFILPYTNDTLTRRPHCPLISAIKPSILKRLAEVKAQCCFGT